MNSSSYPGDSYETFDDVQRPPQPYNLTVHPYRNSLLLSWQSRRPTARVAEAYVDPRQVRRPTADYYVVEYRTVGQWVPLVDRIVGRTSYNWTTPSRGATYHFRVIAYYLADDDDELDMPRPVASFPSTVVTFYTGGTHAHSHSSKYSSASQCMDSYIIALVVYRTPWSVGQKSGYGSGAVTRCDHWTGRGFHSLWFAEPSITAKYNGT